MKWFNNLSVLVRLLAGFIIVAILAVVVGIVGIRNLNTIAQADMDLYTKKTLSVQYAGSIATIYQKQRV
ncbi:MAG TPA: MCP four helix bundle domain-containing protein, partial [Spirochaetota bacterium]|nr:MCP four helix bundle domain-containing protein [Spirochaetota bacterium]